METVTVTNFSNGSRNLDGYTHRDALLLQHVHNVAGRAVAKELPQCLLVPGNLVLLHQLQKISRRITGQRGLGKVRIRRKEIFGSGVQVGEITPPPAGDQNLLADTVGMLQQEDATAAAARMHGAKQASGAGSHNEYVIVGAGVTI